MAMKRKKRLGIILKVLVPVVMVIILTVSVYNFFWRPQTFYLFGQVIDSNGEPIIGAEVFLPEQGAEVLTDDKGRFTFPPIKTGRVTIRAEVEGFHPYEEAISGVGGNRIHLLITLVEVGKEESLIRIKVFDEETKSPLVGSVVNMGETVWYTNEDGLATIPLKAGIHSIEVLHPGYQPYRIFGIETFTGKTTNLEVALNKEKPLPGTYGNLEVKVTDAQTGRAISQVSVQVGEKKGVTDIEGYLLLTEVPAQSLEVIFTASGYLVYREVVSIKVNETTVLNVRMLSGQQGRGGITGIIKDSSDGLPLSGVSVEGRAVKVQTGLDGRFVFPDLVPGPLTLSISLKGYQTTSREIQIEANRVLQLEIFLEKIVVEIDLSGRVRGINNQAVVRARISVGNMQVLTDEEGKFFLKIRDGRRTVLIEKEGFYTHTGTLTDDPTIKEFNLDILIYKVVPDGIYTGKASSSQGAVEMEVEVTAGRISGLKALYYEGSSTFMNLFQEKLMEVAREVLRMNPHDFLRNFIPVEDGPKEVILLAIRQALSLP
ncbi:MAG: hypothetical protein DDT40_00649 [candidate division WS2 bacterium]|nr:hypothetical protein [Candidatus Psychracetigena formicireducens]